MPKIEKELTIEFDNSVTAVKANNLEKVKETDNSLLFAKDNHGKTALHQAVQNGKVGAIDIVLRASASVNEQLECGLTPLSLFLQRVGSVVYPPMGIVKLLAAGASFLEE